MRRELLLEALAYPSLLAQQLLDQGTTPHASFNDTTGQKRGEYTEGCWDKFCEDMRQFDNKTTQYLSESLREGIKLVEALHSELRHDETTCQCEVCTWIRNAEHLTEESEHHLPHVEPAVISHSIEKVQAE